MTSKVLNKYKLLQGEVGIDISRSSPWGNPFPANGPKDRDRVCDLFALYLLTLPKAFIVRAIAELKGHNLICSCAPLRCHGDDWLRVVNDDEYLATHYPVLQQLPRIDQVQDVQTILKDLSQLKELNPEIVEVYGQTVPKIIKDRKLLTQTKYHNILKRYCTQLSIFNCSLEDDESSRTFYYHQTYFACSVNVIAMLEECRFKYNDLLELHVATLLLFNSLATIATHKATSDLKKHASLLDKYTPIDFHAVKAQLIREDKVMMPGTDTSILSFLRHYQSLLEL